MGQHEIARRLVNGVWTTIDVLEDGGGPGGDWGGASNAQFSGSGTPVGNVTPSAEGDLYIDTTTPALWQATGLTNADWQQVGQGGSQPQVANGYDRILASISDGSESAIWSIGADGRGLRQHTTKVTGFYDYVASWEPTERKLILFQRYNNDTGRYDLETVDTETGAVVELTTGFNVAGLGGLNGAYGPDGTKIVFTAGEAVAGSSLWVMDADGSGKTKIVDNADYHDAVISNDDCSAWSPDGTRIAFGITDSATAGDNGLWVCDADGSNQTQVISQATAGGTVVSVAWSCNDLLAYSVNASPYELHTINPDGTGDAQVGTIDAYFVRWSPDGSRLAVATNTSVNRIVDLEGAASVLPTTDGYPLGWGSAGDAPPWGSTGAVAAFVANGSTVDQLRDSLIAAGLVAPS